MDEIRCSNTNLAVRNDQTVIVYDTNVDRSFDAANCDARSNIFDVLFVLSRVEVTSIEVTLDANLVERNASDGVLALSENGNEILFLGFSSKEETLLRKRRLFDDVRSVRVNCFGTQVCLSFA